MNSKQRRHQRVFAYEVVLHCRDTERYFEFDRRVDQAKGWLQWRSKRKNWMQSHHGYNSITFKFSNEGLATLFALKWA